MPYDSNMYFEKNGITISKIHKKKNNSRRHLVNRCLLIPLKSTYMTANIQQIHTIRFPPKKAINSADTIDGNKYQTLPFHL